MKELTNILSIFLKLHVIVRKLNRKQMRCALPDVSGGRRSLAFQESIFYHYHYLGTLIKEQEI